MKNDFLVSIYYYISQHEHDPGHLIFLFKLNSLDTFSERQKRHYVVISLLQPGTTAQHFPKV